MLMAFKQGDRSVTMVCGVSAVRVKQRVIFAYLYHKYESQDSVSWLHKNAMAWVDSILARNK